MFNLYLQTIHSHAIEIKILMLKKTLKILTRLTQKNKLLVYYLIFIYLIIKAALITLIMNLSNYLKLQLHNH